MDDILLFIMIDDDCYDDAGYPIGLIDK